MPEKWRPKPAVLSSRRITARNAIVRKTRGSYVLGESIELHSNQPAMDSIWNWREAVEDIPHIS